MLCCSIEMYVRLSLLHMPWAANLVDKWERNKWGENPLLLYQHKNRNKYFVIVAFIDKEWSDHVRKPLAERETWEVLPLAERETWGFTPGRKRDVRFYPWQKERRERSYSWQKERRERFYPWQKERREKRYLVHCPCQRHPGPARSSVAAARWPGWRWWWWRPPPHTGPRTAVCCRPLPRDWLLKTSSHLFTVI